MAGQRAYNKEFAKFADQLSKAKLKISTESKIPENSGNKIENKEKTLESILPKVNSKANKSTEINEQGLSLCELRNFGGI